MEFDYRNEWGLPRVPVFARNVVATSHPLAAQAGVRMLWAGGNAVDAAIAVAAALTIVEPVSNGLGSDAFCILWDGVRLHGLNASGRAPAAWTPDYFADRHPGSTTPPARGIDSVTVPGAVGAWAALSERFGSLPFAELMRPAIEIAERGSLVPPIIQRKWAAAAPILESFPGFAETFLPNGRAPRVGEQFRFPAAGRALRAIADSAGRAFYEGEIADAIARFAARAGGALGRDDLAAFHPEWVDPIGVDYRGHHVHELPPNGQGIAALLALGILARFDLAELPPDGVLAHHLQLEAMKLAIADLRHHVGDPGAMEVSPDALLDDAYLDARAALIDPARAQRFGPGAPRSGGTVYLTAADERGMMVSFIQSNYMGFGSGCVEPEFGISLQNRGHAFSLGAGPNRVAPRRRPFHTIIPGFLTRDGDPVMSFGVMGGDMQPQGHVQTLVRMLDHRQSPQSACDAPRWRVDGDGILLEEGVPDETARGLEALGHRIGMPADRYEHFGAGQFIWRAGDPAVEGYIAASDPRRDGQAAGF